MMDPPFKGAELMFTFVEVGAMDEKDAAVVVVVVASADVETEDEGN